MRSTLAPISALLLGVLFLISGHGLQITLVPLRATAEGWSPFAIGAIGSAYYVGFVFGCLAGPFVILRAGHIRAFAAMVALTSATTLCQALFVAIAPWLGFRFVIGACLAAIYLIIESWLNDRATNANRGLLMATYILVNFVALTAGQFLMTLAPPTDFTLFAVAAIVMSLATIPVVLSNSAQPAPITIVRFRPAALYRASPVGIVGVSVIGLANGAFWALAAVYAVGEGLTAQQAAIFTGLATVGGAIGQWPAGLISDRVDRRIVLVCLLTAAAVVGFVLTFLPIGGYIWMPLAVLFGICTLPTYSVAAAHAYDHAERGSYVETSAGILLANGAGSIAGPLLAAGLMEVTTTSALFLFTGASQGLLALFVISRLRVRPSPKDADKTSFDLAATAPVGGVISPASPDPADPNVVVPGPDAADEDRPV